MQAEARSLPPDGSLEAGLRDLRDAIESREAEHARRNANRVLFSRGVFLFFLGIFAGLVILGRGFDQDVFRDRLTQRLQAGAPKVIQQLKASLTELTPLYQLEITRTMPTFTESATSALKAEATRLEEPLTPTVVGDYLPLTEGANQEFAAALLKRFGPELGNDPAKALAVARAIRAEELKEGARKDLGGTVAVLEETGQAIRSVGAPDARGLNNPDVATALTTAAMDTVKTKLMSGEFGFGPEEKTAPHATKGGK